ncbi:hypothetical protein IQ266_02925 [filamentous cyanobacterium LEGE 11480]|uniref:DUF4432 family protein n=1 Tax=Romeriopsis navalis LEGE 11480 TaxID=2777977 RepID=A0A928Z0W7_9CYAN|nr:DUF4380 domain-containing protein [Romeriopsis navalis]MBE9028711.1 hypothetical protein [Romeriopsis navalis LEGE 11480]
MNISPLELRRYAGWSNAVWVIGHGALQLVLVPEVGGRIMGIRWQDQDLTWVNPALAGQPLDISELEHPATDKVSLGFPLWGGDKTWLAPQDRWNNQLPFIDLDSGAYEFVVLEQSPAQITVQMISPICRETGIQITRTLHVGTIDQGWSVIHKIENCTDQSVEWGIWGNSMMRRPATVFLPIRADSSFPQGVKTFESEGEAIGARSQVVEPLDGFAAIRCEAPLKFKYGVDSDEGLILAVFPDQDNQYVAHLKQFLTFHPQPYGHGCVAEVFNAEAYDYLELEIHGPVQRLQPQESVELLEENRLINLSTMPTTATEVQQVLSQMHSMASRL